jgi:hypothetical protein
MDTSYGRPEISAIVPSAFSNEPMVSACLKVAFYFRLPDNVDVKLPRIHHVKGAFTVISALLNSMDAI